MSDSIFVRDLRVETRIGWSVEERASARPVTVTIQLHTDTARAGESDELADTVDYHQVTVDVAALVSGLETKLIEHLAERIAGLCLAFRGVTGVTVEVEKDNPPIEADVGAVAVRIHRGE